MAFPIPLSAPSSPPARRASLSTHATPLPLPAWRRPSFSLRDSAPPSPPWQRSSLPFHPRDAPPSPTARRRPSLSTMVALLPLSIAVALLPPSSLCGGAPPSSPRRRSFLPTSLFPISRRRRGASTTWGGRIRQQRAWGASPGGGACTGAGSDERSSGSSHRSYGSVGQIR